MHTPRVFSTQHKPTCNSMPRSSSYPGSDFRTPWPTAAPVSLAGMDNLLRCWQLVRANRCCPEGGAHTTVRSLMPVKAPSELHTPAGSSMSGAMSTSFARSFAAVSFSRPAAKHCVSYEFSCTAKEARPVSRPRSTVLLNSAVPAPSLCNCSCRPAGNMAS